MISGVNNSIDEILKEVSGTALEQYLVQMRGRYSFLMSRLGEIATQGQVVVEAGASPGILTLLMQKLGYEVTALDLAPDIPFTAKTEKNDKNLFKDFSIPVIKTDISNCPLPLKSGCADVVMMNETIEHFTEPPLFCIKEISRVLKPGGYLILTTPNVASLSNRIKLLAGINVYTEIDIYHKVSKYKLHNREYTMKDLEYLAAEAGLKTVDKRCLNLGGAPLPPVKNMVRNVYYMVNNLIPGSATNLYLLAKKP